MAREKQTGFSSPTVTKYQRDGLRVDERVGNFLPFHLAVEAGNVGETNLVVHVDLNADSKLVSYGRADTKMVVMQTVQTAVVMCVYRRRNGFGGFWFIYVAELIGDIARKREMGEYTTSELEVSLLQASESS